jgi:hypothetical protein
MSKWIKVEDMLPEDGVWVLTFSGSIADDFQWDIGWCIGGKWKCLGWDYPVTHWMPLPKAPKG